MLKPWIPLAAGLLALAACGGGEKASSNKGAVSTAKPDEKSAPTPSEKPAPTPSEPGTATEIVLWHTYRDAEAKALDTVVARWNESDAGKKSPVRAEANPYDGFADKLSAAIPRGNGPDVFIFAHDRIGGWAKSNIVAPIQEEVGENPAIIDLFWPETLPPLEFGEQLYGLPLAFKSAVLFYNTDLVKTPPKDTAELINVARSLSNEKDKTFGLVYPHSDLFHHSPWLFAFGGKVLDGETPALNTPENAKSLDFAKSLIDAKLIPSEVSPADLASLFNGKKAAMVINGPWFRGEIAAGTPYAVAPLPLVTETQKPASPFLTVEAILLSAQGKHKKEAFAFAAFLATEGAAARLSEGKQSVAAKAPYDSPEAKADATLQVFLAQLKNTTPTPNIPAMNAVWAPFNQALEATLTGRSPAQDALAASQLKALGQ